MNSAITNKSDSSSDKENDADKFDDGDNFLKFNLNL